MSTASLLAAFGLGLLGVTHCVGMCGGIISGLSLGHGAASRPWRFILGYNLGRIGSYTLIGLLTAILVQNLPSSPLPLARTVAGLVLIAMGLYIAQWWRVITWLEKAGYILWRRIQPLAQRFLPIRSFLGALLVGGIWGWLPCGLVYSALVYAAASGGVWQSGATMLAFGLGTLPALLSSGLILGWLRRKMTIPWFKSLLGVAYIVFGVWTMGLAWLHAGHGAHHEGHSHHSIQTSPQNPLHSVEQQPLDDDGHHHHHDH